MDMGGAASFKPFSATIFPFFPIIIVVTVTTLILITSAEDDSKEEYGIPDLKHNTSSSPPMGSTESSTRQEATDSEALKPGTVMIMGVLTTTFSLTFLLLVYIKHCNNGNTLVPSTNANVNPQGEARSHERKDSGIEREVVELLPAFRFGSLRGQKEGLDCAVCLNGFDDAEVLRLLPKCKHAFHVECVDRWLGAHSTCPLCRYKVEPEDVVVPPNAEGEALENIERGERDSGVLQIILQQEGNNSALTSFRSLERTGSGGSRKIRSEEGVGSSVGPRKDGAERRLEHRIIVSPFSSSRMGGERWSDVEASGMLYLTSDMIIISDVASSSQGNARGGNHINVVDGEEIENGSGGGGGRGVVSKYLRSVSEMTGMRRFLSGNSRERRWERERGGRREQEQQQEGVV